MLRRRYPGAERPFRLTAIPVVAAALCLLLLLLFQQPLVNLLAPLAALAVGLVLYALGRSRSPSPRDER